MSIAGVRPALLADETAYLLDNLRSFQHLFRHAYAHEIDPRKIQLVLASAMQLREQYRKDVGNFLDSLQAGATT